MLVKSVINSFKSIRTHKANIKFLPVDTVTLIQRGFGHIKRQKEKLLGAGLLNLSTLIMYSARVALSFQRLVLHTIGGLSHIIQSCMKD